MKKVLVLISFVLALPICAFAGTSESNSTAVKHLIGIGMEPLKAQEIADLASGFAQQSTSILPDTDATYNLGSSTKSWSYLYVGNLQFTVASPKILPGATLLDFRNNANNADNLIIKDAGEVDVSRGDLLLKLSGNTVGITETTPSSACRGVSTPNGTTNVAVSTTCATTGARIFYEREGAVANMGQISTTVAANGTGFSFASTGASDTLASSVIWFIEH